VFFSARVNFEGLFNGNKALGDSTNLFFNENWRDILKELKPALGQSFGSIYTTLINSVFGNIPYDEVLSN
jgi:Haemolymph juvenile hormone binding protein (JHBP)